jgi:aryl-alcohol dehydrogenase-like predicted oxidoreductase
VSSAIIGATRPEQVLENTVAAELDLDDDLVTAIDEVLAPAILRDAGFTLSPETRPEN